MLLQGCELYLGTKDMTERSLSHNALGHTYQWWLSKLLV